MNLLYTTRILGVLLMVFSSAQILPACVAFYYSETSLIYVFLYTLLATFVCGFILYLISSNRKEDLRTKDGFLITVLFWFVLAIFGSFPFYFSDVIDISYIDSLFESISGLTTTGATVLMGLDDKILNSLYICMLSALMISPFNLLANCIASLDFPDAVGPAKRIIFLDKLI